MHGYSISEICKILGEKKHIIRYWEQEVSFLNPRKDIYGKRIYSNFDLNLLFRLKFLVHHKGMHLKKASQTLWKEMVSDNQDMRLKIHELREIFVQLQLKVFSQTSEIEKIFDMKTKYDDTRNNGSDN